MIVISLLGVVSWRNWTFKADFRKVIWSPLGLVRSLMRCFFCFFLASSVFFLFLKKKKKNWQRSICGQITFSNLLPLSYLWQHILYSHSGFLYFPLLEFFSLFFKSPSPLPPFRPVKKAMSARANESFCFFYKTRNLKKLDPYKLCFSLIFKLRSEILFLHYLFFL